MCDEVEKLLAENKKLIGELDYCLEADLRAIRARHEAWSALAEFKKAAVAQNERAGL